MGWRPGLCIHSKYKLPSSQMLDKTVAGSFKRLVSRFYQLETGHCLYGQ